MKVLEHWIRGDIHRWCGEGSNMSEEEGKRPEDFPVAKPENETVTGDTPDAGDPATPGTGPTTPPDEPESKE